MVGLDHVHPELADPYAVAGLDLPQISEATEQPRTSARQQDRQLACERAQRGNVEMVVVEVGQQHCRGACRDGGRAGSPEMGDAAPQDRIGDDALAVQVDYDGRVPEPGHGPAHAASQARRSMPRGSGCGGRSPAG